MRFQLVSDIHLEKYDELPDLKNFIEVSAPNLVLAGDICFILHKNYIPFFEKISKLYDNIFYVFGNHEYYINWHNGGIEGHTFSTLEEVAYQKLKHLKNVFIMNNKSMVIDDLVIIGTPLWCKFSLNDYRSKHVKYINNDLFLLYKNKICPKDTVISEIHEYQKKWLEYEINRYENNKMILVITHYLPSKKCISDKWQNDEDNDQFYSDLEHLVEKVNLWVCGHTHVPMVAHVNKTPIIINPKGNPGESEWIKVNPDGLGENPIFDTRCTFSIYSKL